MIQLFALITVAVEVAETRNIELPRDSTIYPEGGLTAIFPMTNAKSFNVDDAVPAPKTGAKPSVISTTTDMVYVNPTTVVKLVL